MKIRLPIIFLLGVFALLSSTLYFLRNPDSFQNGRFSAYAASNLILYGDQLSPSFSDWSWGSERNFNATEQTKEGAAAIGFTPQAWGGLYFHTESQLDTSLYESVTFSLRGSTDQQRFSFILYDNNNQMIGQPHPISDFGGAVEANTWKTYTIPLKAINPSQLPIKGLGIQEATGQNQPTVYLDSMFLTPSGQIEPTTTQNITPTLNQAPLPSPAPTTQIPTVSIFSDAINSNWENWSWNSEVDDQNASPVSQGNRSIRLRTTSAWGALYLHAKNLFSTNNYTHLQFSLYASAPNQSYAIILLDQYNNPLTSPLSLQTIAGAPVQGSWKTYTIPLAEVNASTKAISGIIIQDQSGNSQPALFIDEIEFMATTPTVAIPQTVSPLPSSGTNPLTSLPLYVDPNSHARKTADAWRANGRSADADQIEKIAKNATAVWLTGGDPTTTVREYITRAKEANSLPVMITYNIPGRDCGQYSSGGTTYEQYKNWMQTIATTIGDTKAVVILEPDALGLDCLQNENTYSLLRYAVETLRVHPSTTVYVTASTWIPAESTASRLGSVSIEKADGFAINVSGFDATSEMIRYGTAVSQKIGNKHFVIDTSRNGNGPYDQSQYEPWCNPPGRALGIRPTTNTGNTLVDAYLWLKIPGESDGTCRGGPSAGLWWPEYALGLAQKAAY